MLTSKTGILIMALLWLVMCLRFWRLAGPSNPGQRHLIALAGGLGAGLIYFLGTLVSGLLQRPSSAASDAPAEPTRLEDIRIAPGRADAP